MADDALTQTPLPPDALLARLEAAAEQDGRVRYRRQGDAGFTLRKVGGRNSMRPTLRAELTATGQGTAIRAAAPRPVWAVWFARLWWLGSVGLGLAILSFIVMTGTVELGILLPILALPVMGGAIFGAAANAGDAEGRFLHEWLGANAVPEAPGEAQGDAARAAQRRAAAKQGV